MEALIKIALVSIMMLIAYFIGGRREKKHYQSIAQRHQQLLHISVFNGKTVPAELSNTHEGQLVHGVVVVGQDYFKMIVAGLRNLFGGNLSTYETLLDRARKEAILRLKAQADLLGAQMIINVRLETSGLSDGTNPNANSNCIEILAYGTALTPKPVQSTTVDNTHAVSP